MTVHRRIRPFNTRETYPEQNLDNDLCQAVVAGNTVYLRGQIGQDLDTSENVGVGDVEAQAEQAMKNIATAARGGRRRPGAHRQGHRLPDRPALPRAGLPRDGPLAEGRAPGVDGDRRQRAGTARSGWWRSTRPRCSRDVRDPRALRADGTVGHGDHVVESGGRGAVRERARRRRGRVVAERHRPAVGTQAPGRARRAALGRTPRCRRSPRPRRTASTASSRWSTRRAAAPRGAAPARSACTAPAPATAGRRPATCWPPSPSSTRSARRSPIRRRRAGGAADRRARRPGSRPVARRGRCDSAGLLVADAVAWPVTDLRVDWAAGTTPIAELAATLGRLGPAARRLRDARARPGFRARLRRPRATRE